MCQPQKTSNIQSIQTQKIEYKNDGADDEAADRDEFGLSCAENAGIFHNFAMETIPLPAVANNGVNTP
jgi:hypothetical protein